MLDSRWEIVGYSLRNGGQEVFPVWSSVLSTPCFDMTKQKAVVSVQTLAYGFRYGPRAHRLQGVQPGPRQTPSLPPLSFRWNECVVLKLTSPTLLLRATRTPLGSTLLRTTLK